MWTTIKDSYKTILTTLGIQIVSIVVAFLFENYYRQLVRFSFKFFNGDDIQFIGKNFHLFASDSFVITFGLFTSLTFLLLKYSSHPKRIPRVSFTIFVFFAFTFLITALDSKRLIIECTSCADGIRKLTFNEITYDKYFIISLTTAIIYLLTTYLLEHKLLKKNEH